MLQFGTFQTLVIVQTGEHGVYLAEREGAPEKVLLPRKYVTDDMRYGARAEVFLYKDSEDRPVATTRHPYLTLGEVAALRVKEVAKIGGFLDWGLEKDLFLPYKEMVGQVSVGDMVLVRLYLDKSGRLAASMKKLYGLLSTDAPYAIGDEVEGRIYEFGHDFGTFVAVDDRYSAMIPKHEDMRAHRIGDLIRARVTGIKDDGKLDISTKKGRADQMDEDARLVMRVIDGYAGVLPFTEKAEPSVILRETGLSKAAFKRAVGRLYKERRIVIDDGRIRRA